MNVKLLFQLWLIKQKLNKQNLLQTFLVASKVKIIQIIIFVGAICNRIWLYYIIIDSLLRLFLTLKNKLNESKDALQKIVLIKLNDIEPSNILPLTY